MRLLRFLRASQLLLAGVTTTIRGLTTPLLDDSTVSSSIHVEARAAVRTLMTSTSLIALLLLPISLTLLACLLFAVVLLRVRSAFRHYHTNGYSRITSRATVNGRSTVE